MKKLLFESPCGQTIVITIKKEKIFFSNRSFGMDNVAIEETFTRSNALAIIREYPELSYLPHSEVIEVGKEKWRDKIKSLGSEDNIKKYVIDDMCNHGLVYMGEFNE